MKYKSNSFLAALAISGGFLSTPFAQAVDRVWDSNTTGGTWDWNLGTNWIGGTAPIVNTDRADLRKDWTNTNAINLSAATTINGILFDDTGASGDVGVTLGNGGNAANTLTLAGTTPVINVANTGNTLTVSAVMAGSTGWNKTGPGTLILTGANHGVTAGVDVQGGVLSVSNIADTGTGSQIGNFTSGGSPWLGVNGGTFRYTGTTAATTARQIWVNSVDGTFDITEATGSLALTGTGSVSRRVTKTGAGTLSITQAITGASGGVTVNAGTFTLANIANTYTGNTIISGGTLNLATGKIYTSGKNGANSLVINGGGTLVGSDWAWAGTLGALQYNTGNIAVDNGTIRNVAVADAAFQGRGVAIGAGGITYENATASTTWTINNNGAGFTNTYAANATVKLAGVGNGSFEQVILGTNTGVGVTKSGAGTWTLTQANTYTGATTVKSGTLKLGAAGSIDSSTSIVVGDTGSSGAVLDVSAKTTDFTVGATQTLSGIGTVNAVGRKVIVDGAIAPGNSAGMFSVSTVSAADGLTFGTTGALNIEMTRGITPGAGTNYDQLGLTGGLTIMAGADLNLSALGSGAWTVNDIYFLIANDGADAITGAFDGFAEGATITFDSQQFKTTYLADSIGNSFTGGNDFALQVVPEPNVAALIGGFGVLALLRRRRA